MASAGTSPLLHCIEQLNGDVWSNVLLPKLVRDSSAAAVASSCSTLRKLCHSSVQVLRIKDVSSSGGEFTTIKRHVAALHQHFPYCTGVKLALAQDSCYLLAPAIMEGLSRLSRLHVLELTAEAGCPLALAMVLSSINTQLPQLRRLILTSKRSLSGAQAIWEQLGQATQLSHLAFGFDKAVDVGAHVKDLAPLSSLTGLQKLQFRLANKAVQLQPEEADSNDAQFLAHLTALDELSGDFVLRDGMVQHISSCTALQSLSLQVGGLVVRPSSSDWQALGSLSHVTRLFVSGRLVRGQDPQPFYSALGNLTGLQWLGAGRGALTWGVLPTLAALTKLTNVSGPWEGGDQGWDSDGVCGHVVTVGDASRCVPFRAFPNVESVCLAGPLDTAAWVALGSYCPKVTEIMMRVPEPSARPAWPCFPPAATGPERVVALKGLAQLTGLVQLTFSISHKLEVVALAHVMQQVPALRRLVLVLCASPELDWGCLLPLGKLTSVTIADLTMRVPLPSKHDAQVLLSAFAHIPHLSLVVSIEDMAVVEEAARDSIAMGLELPQQEIVIRQLLDVAIHDG